MNSETGEFLFYPDLQELPGTSHPAPAVQQAVKVRRPEPRLSLARGTRGGIDPYNSTGASHRGNAWQGVRKR